MRLYETGALIMPKLHQVEVESLWFLL